MALLAPAILVVFGGAFSGGLGAPPRGGTFATVQLHDLAGPSVPTQVWGPPALSYSVAASPGAAVHSGAQVAPGTLAAATASNGAAAGGFDPGAFTPMTHCSKMPHIMDLQGR